LIDALLSGPLLGGALPAVTWIGALLTAAWPRSGLLGFRDAEDMLDDVVAFLKRRTFTCERHGEKTATSALPTHPTHPFATQEDSEV
jgi:hypothetical protein